MRGGAILFCALLCGCTVGPDFHPPAPPDLQSWNDLAKHRDDAVTTEANPDPLWWNAFGDPVLTRLMNLAIAGNPSLGEAELRIVSANQNVVTAAAVGLPSLSGNASYMRELLGVKGILESQGAYGKLNELADASSPVNQYAPGLGNEIAQAGTGALDQISGPTNIYQYGLSSSWELDLFGKVRRSVEAAKASAQAQAEAANDALVMLESEVGQAYFQLRGAQMLEQQQQQDVRIAQNTLQLTQSRQSRGLDSDADVEQARTQWLSEESQADAYEKQADQAIDEINDLAGQPPGTLDAALANPAPLPDIPEIGIGLPSTLARRRPDIREAEANLHAATAEVGVAVASFYPDISLTGSLGLRALDANYLTNWASLFYAAGPSISLPVFEGGKLAASLKMARAQQISAALNYRGTVLNALREVEDALVACRTDRATAEQTQATVQAASFSLYLATNRYQHGLSSYLQVLSAQQSLVAANQQLAQAKLAVANDVVTLYTALGGGWQNENTQVPSLPVKPPALPAALDTAAD